MEIKVNDLVEGGIYYVDENKAPDEDAVKYGFGGFVRFNKVQSRPVVVYQQPDGTFDWKGAKMEEHTEWSFKNLDESSCWGGFVYDDEKEFLEDGIGKFDGADFDWPSVQDMVEEAGFQSEENRMIYTTTEGKHIILEPNKDYKDDMSVFKVSIDNEDSMAFRYVHELQRYLIDHGYKELSDNIGNEQE